MNHQKHVKNQIHIVTHTSGTLECASESNLHVTSVELWHERIGHVKFGSIRTLIWIWFLKRR